MSTREGTALLVLLRTSFFCPNWLSVQ